MHLLTNYECLKTFARCEHLKSDELKQKCAFISQIAVFSQMDVSNSCKLETSKPFLFKGHIVLLFIDLLLSWLRAIAPSLLNMGCFPLQ